MVVTYGRGMPRTIDLPGGWPLLLDAVVSAAAGRRPVVLLDGGSGSGKTTLARALRRELTDRLGPIQLVSLDDCYPGWHGLARASEWVWQTILAPDHPGHRTWDWQHDRPAGWVPLDPSLPIIVEGCGALSLASAPMASTTLWYERPEAQRRRRALGRADGDGFRPWWDEWARQEAALWALNHPREPASWVLRGDLVAAGTISAED